jgi:hypothetical protein
MNNLKNNQNDQIELINEKLIPLPNLDNFLSKNEAAKLLKVTIVSLLNWEKKGILKYTKIGGRKFYHVRDIYNLLGIEYNKINN